MIGHLLKPEIAELIHARNFTQLRELLVGFAAGDIAEIFTDLNPEEEAVLLRVTGRDWSKELAAWVHSTQELPLQELLTQHGVQVHNDPAQWAQRLGLFFHHAARRISSFSRRCFLRT